MGLVHLPTFKNLPWKSTLHVGRYTIHADTPQPEPDTLWPNARSPCHGTSPMYAMGAPVKPMAKGVGSGSHLLNCILKPLKKHLENQIHTAHSTVDG